MGYALFAQRKIQLTGQINAISLQQTQRSNEQYLLATNTLSLQQQMTSLQASQSLELAALYADLANVGKDNASSANPLSDDQLDDIRDSINAKIKATENKFNAEIDTINRSIYLVSVKENSVEMQVKRLDTMITALQKQLDAVEDAESSAIEKATPKFKGVA